MDTPEEQQGKGILDQASGRVKKAAGDLLDDPKLKREGAIDDIKGKAESKIGGVRRDLDR